MTRYQVMLQECSRIKHIVQHCGTD